MPAPNTPSSLWGFALTFYAKPQIAETCIDLQDNYGCNVCLLISLRWLDEREEYLSAAELINLELHVHAWTQQVIEPLRALRRLLKQPLADYAQDDAQVQIRILIKDAELLAEKKLLAEIELWLEKLSSAVESNGNSNIANYLEKLSAPKKVIELIQKY